MSNQERKTRQERKANKNKNETKKRTKKKSKKKLSIFRLVLVIFIMIVFISVGAVGGLILGIAKNAPKINPSQITALLSENSVIVDENNNIIEKIQAEELRDIVTLDKIPIYLQNAFIAIEDQRFRAHHGIDPVRIIGALVADIKAGSAKEGASTITQQLSRNVYLSNEKKLDRKIKEMYLSIQIERELTKDQILEAYLNTIPLGQGSYGVQAAAHTYFSKDASELTIAESALIAGVTKGTSIYAPFKRVSESNLESVQEEDIVGHLIVAGTQYAAVFNEKSVERQRLILSTMKDLNFITESEYNEAINQDIRASLNPEQKKLEGISSYFADYVKEEVVEELLATGDYTKEEAYQLLYNGGLKIYSTMDIGMQHKLEDIYDNFGEYLFGDLSKVKNPVLEQWSRFYRTSTGSKGNLDTSNNLVDEYGNIRYYKEDNIFDENFNLIISSKNYSIGDNGDLIINSKKFNIYSKTIDIVDYYTIDEKKNLVTHTIGSLDLQGNYSTENVKYSKGKLIINSDFLNDNNFYTVDENNNLLINPKYFPLDSTGVVQPQSASVITDYRTGEIKALVGGRNIKQSKTFNRATNAKRQPGSVIKPISIYLPALDNGFTTADIFDDIPRYNSKGERWPKNWYEYKKSPLKYRGLTTLREAVEQSVNVIAVNLLEKIGIDTSIEYLTRLGIVDQENPEKDSFISRSENPRTNDETLASLALGGMTYGLTPMEMSSAFGSIANDGVYIEPISFTKVLDRDGKVILEKKPLKNSVVTPQVAYLMTDVLRSTVTSGLGNRAKLFPGNANIPVAGKTGTTQSKGDIWFVGYTPYYSASVWIGNDDPKLKLSSGSTKAAEYWSTIMKKAHEDLPAKDFIEPEGLVRARICTESGKLVTTFCLNDQRGDTSRVELFLKGTEPTEYCTTHVEAVIDTSNGKLATDFCPPELIEKKVFIQRDLPYNPEENDGIIPKDYQYTLPTEYCDIHTEPEPVPEEEESEGESMLDRLKNWFENGNNVDEEDKQENNDVEIIDSQEQ